MQEKSISGKRISRAITSEDILGKEVIDSEGGHVGVVEKIFIDQKLMDFIGISVDRGLIKSGLTIGKNYINRITDHAILLKIRVVFDIKGMLVFDRDGKKVGKVRSIDLYGNKNKIKKVYVKSGSLFREDIVIGPEIIESSGENIILNVRLKDLTKNK